jgi:hypothetical protein
VVAGRRGAGLVGRGSTRAARSEPKVAPAVLVGQVVRDGRQGGRRKGGEIRWREWKI